MVNFKKEYGNCQAQKKAHHLKKHRKARGLNQKEVAKILGLKSSSMVSRWEKGICMPKPKTMFKLAILYRTMVDNLFLDLRQGLKEEIQEREESILGNKNQIGSES